MRKLINSSSRETELPMMALSKFGIHTHDTTRECVLSLQRMGGSDILLGCERVGGGGEERGVR
jgi:hypothetical protein